VRLPYRVGVWVSQSDITGGAAADDEELTALNNILHGFDGQVFGSEFLQYVMAETLENKDKWDQWGQKIEKVPEECQKAIDVLGDYLGHKERVAYANRLMEIGEAVAMAFREYDENLGMIQKLMLFLEYQGNKKKAARHDKIIRSFDEYLNISANERKALGEIAKALGTVYV
jgi:hypothetical protein